MKWIYYKTVHVIFPFHSRSDWEVDVNLASTLNSALFVHFSLFAGHQKRTLISLLRIKFFARQLNVNVNKPIFVGVNMWNKDSIKKLFGFLTIVLDKIR